MKWFLMVAVLAWGAQDTGPPAEAGPPSPRETSLAPNVPLPDPAADLSDDKIEEVRMDAPPDPGIGTRQDRGAELAGDDDEEEEEEENVEEETGSGGEETMDTPQHRTDEEAEAALAEVRKWIAWQGYVPVKQLVWRGARCSSARLWGCLVSSPTPVSLCRASAGLLHQTLPPPPPPPCAIGAIFWLKISCTPAEMC